MSWRAAPLNALARAMDRESVYGAMLAGVAIPRALGTLVVDADGTYKTAVGVGGESVTATGAILIGVVGVATGFVEGLPGK